jgi:hypothetical protein
MQEEPLFHPAVGYRAPGLRIVSSLEKQPGGVPSSDCSGAFVEFCLECRGQGQEQFPVRIIWLVFLHISVYHIRSQLFIKVCKRHVHSLSHHKSNLNDDTLSRTLDAIFDYGPTELFNELTLQVMNKMTEETHLLRMDATNFSMFVNMKVML